MRVRKLLHGRVWQYERSRINAAVSKREINSAAGRIGSAINSVLGRHQATYGFEKLALPDGSITTDPTSIHNSVAKSFQDWFTRDPRPTLGSTMQTTGRTSFMIARVSKPTVANSASPFT